ncbi:MAG: hypothetical protein F6J95_017645 [Leptolyngbya sp. SIO1E4]|nr:hypothetical protein [Leptolyngbya sp. SIO1E4]
MGKLSPEEVYKNLEQIDQADTVHGADYRRQAIAVLSDLHVSLEWRQAIAKRLDQADHLLALRTVDGEDSY